MEIFEYQVIMARIKEIEQEQLQWVDYVDKNVDYIIDVQRENVRDRMLQLREEKEKLYEYIK